MAHDDVNDFTPLDTSEKSILLPEVADVAFAYFGSENGLSDAKWYDEWTFPARMPTMIRIRALGSGRELVTEMVMKVMTGGGGGMPGERLPTPVPSAQAQSMRRALPRSQRGRRAGAGDLGVDPAHGDRVELHHGAAHRGAHREELDFHGARVRRGPMRACSARLLRRVPATTPRPNLWRRDGQSHDWIVRRHPGARRDARRVC